MSAEKPLDPFGQFGPLFSRQGKIGAQIEKGVLAHPFSVRLDSISRQVRYYYGTARGNKNKYC
jgi:hypothetical protein